MATLSVCKQCHSLNKVDGTKAKATPPVCGKCQAKLPLHGLVTDVTADEFQRILKASKDQPVVVDFWAEWCGPCKMYGPEYEKASWNTNAVFLKVNTETEQQLSAQFGIRGIPCTIVFKNGVEVKRQAGAMNADGVRALIS